jgi:phosphohistidine phosphatase
MANKLKAKEKSPGVMVTSPAFRALETALIFAEEFKVRAEDLIMKSKIYHGLSLKNLPEILSSIGEETETITLFGHNPSFSDLAEDLIKEGCEPLPKSGIACISFNIKTWSEVARNNGKLEYFLKPVKHDEKQVHP